LYLVVSVLLAAVAAHAQNPVIWTPGQLMAPATLAGDIKAGTAVPLIICVGPGAVIPNSIHTGMASEKEGLDSLKAQLSNVPKDRKIVIYCGCCPFEHCPNVRPAINTLKEMNFTNYYLLNIPNNIKKDWIEQGYPVAKQE